MPQQRVSTGWHGKKHNDPRCDTWQENVKSYAGKAIMTMPDRPTVWSPLDGPLWMCCVFYVRRPKTKCFKDGRANVKRFPWPATKPDLKNLMWGVEDALEKIVYTTDSRVVSWLNLRMMTDVRIDVPTPELATCMLFADDREPGVQIEVGEMP